MTIMNASRYLDGVHLVGPPEDPERTQATMYVDTDVSFRVNPYPLLKGPFANFSLVGQDETRHVNGVNIGFVQSAEVEGIL